MSSRVWGNLLIVCLYDMDWHGQKHTLFESRNHLGTSQATAFPPLSLAAPASNAQRGEVCSSSPKGNQSAVSSQPAINLSNFWCLSFRFTIHCWFFKGLQKTSCSPACLLKDQEETVFSSVTSWLEIPSLPCHWQALPTVLPSRCGSEALDLYHILGTDYYSLDLREGWAI